MRRLNPLFSLSSLALWMAACAPAPAPYAPPPPPPAETVPTPPEQSPPETKPDPPDQPENPPTPASGLQPGAGNPSAPESFPAFATADAKAVAKLAASQNAFAAKLYQTAEKPDNFAMSPLSISMAFGMVYAGARKNTAKEMAMTFQYDLPQSEIHAAMGTVLRQLDGQGKPYQLSMANRLFGEKTRAFQPGFMSVTGDHYDSKLEALDFKNAPEAGRKRINAWIAKKTENRIAGLLPPKSVKKDTALVLTNAVYFKGKWRSEFKKASTVEEPFRITKDEKVKTKMMRRHAKYQFSHQGGVKMLELPYKGNDLSMQLFLPDAVDGLGALEKQLALGALDTAVKAKSVHMVDVWLPRFTVSPNKPMKLSKTLTAMGMVLAWDKANADLTGIAKLRPNENMFLQQAFHRAFVEVNEEGTEAAAATAIMGGITATSIGPPPPPPAVFKADHPFLFVIRHTKSNAILFIGRVNNPTKK